MNNRKIKIVFLITGLNVGGAERVVMSLCRFLDVAAFSIVVISLTSKTDILDQYDDVGCEVHSLNMDSGPFGVITGAFRLVAIIHRVRPDIIHAHMFHAMVAGLLCRVVSIRSRLVFTSHSFSGFGWMRSLIIRLTRWFRCADIVFSVSQHPELNAKHTLKIPNGVPIARSESLIRVADRPFIFLFVGRLELPKNPVALVEVFSSMTEQRCELWIVGDGSLRSAVERRIEALGVSDRVRMFGICSDVPGLLNRADCLVLTSSWEGLPMAVLEAGAASLPVISTSVGAIPEVLDEQCGYLSSIDEFPKAMDNVVRDYPEAKRRGEMLYSKVLTYYSVDSMVFRHQQLFSLLVAR